MYTFLEHPSCVGIENWSAEIFDVIFPSYTRRALSVTLGMK